MENWDTGLETKKYMENKMADEKKPTTPRDPAPIREEQTPAKDRGVGVRPPPPKPKGS